MASHCQICKKGPSSGITYVRRGLAKAKGGVGRKITGMFTLDRVPGLDRHSYRPPM